MAVSRDVRHNGCQTRFPYIAAAPQGVTALVSECWGDCTSDEHLTLESDLLMKLIPVDKFLADRGFNISDMMQASLQIPPLLKAWTNFPPTKIEKTRNLANLWIHI